MPEKVSRGGPYRSKPMSIEKLHNLYAEYRTEDFDAGMRALLESPTLLETPLSDSLLFRFVSDCFEGGLQAASRVSNLVLRGSRLAAIIGDAVSHSEALFLPERMQYLVDLGRSYERVLRFLTRIGAQRATVDRAIEILGLGEFFRTFEALDLSPVSKPFGLPPSYSQGEGLILQKTLLGWRPSYPDLKAAAELTIASLPGAVSFGQSSLLVHGDRATTPFSHFKLANENVVRNDSMFISLGPGYIVSRVPPASCVHIPGPSISLTSADSYHFGHFVIENLPRLRAFGALGVRLKEASVVIDTVAERYSPIIRSWNKDIHLRAVVAAEATTHEKLLITRPTSFAASDLTFGSPFVNDESRPTRFELPWELKKPSNPGKGEEPCGRVSLLRAGTGGAPRRRLINHNAVKENLVRLQFHTVGKFELGFDTLEPLLRNSKYVVTEAGASIAMNLFLVDLVGKNVVLLQHPQLNRQEQRMAGRLSARGARVWIVTGKAAGGNRQSDYVVKVSHLRDAVGQMFQ